MPPGIASGAFSRPRHSPIIFFPIPHFHFPFSIVHPASMSTRNGILAGGNWIVDAVKIIDTWPQQDALANILSLQRARGPRDDGRGIPAASGGPRRRG
jgi:hypothetical protein